MMHDGPRYEDDFYAWTQYQADVLRTMSVPDNRFDREHVAEEIEDLGKNERNAMCSEVRRILEHFLKLGYSPAAEPRSDWMVSIANARAELDDRLTATLRREIEAELPRLSLRAKDVAQVGLAKYREADVAADFPAACPYTLEQVLARGWYPDPPGEVK
jgi:Domain of unknown function DUF29